MTGTELRIRPATAADWASIWPFYRAIVDQGESYSYPSPAEEAVSREIWMGPEAGTVVVAVEPDGTVVGSAKWGSNRPGGRGAHVATASFMVDRGSAGRGVGRALGEHVLAAARAAGYASMQFNAVVESNVPAVRLWESLGFAVVGRVPEAYDSATHGRVALLIMWRTLQQ